ncbi:hypothetical protein QE152_g30518 [Popillia japonica]|uniref:Uncharacterized protein n=1 Tax=Popillia japonica TaxID=7064 RepID=A0AAW1JDN9_POPJA
MWHGQDGNLPVFPVKALENSVNRLAACRSEQLDHLKNAKLNTTPAELLFGVDLRLPADLRLKEIIESEYINTYKDEREKMRLAAKQDILKVQEETILPKRLKLYSRTKQAGMAELWDFKTTS